MSIVKYFCSFFILASCTRLVTESEYKAWIRDYDNGLHVRKTVSDFVFDLQYQPVDYLKLARDPSQAIDNTLQYYLLTIGVNNSESNLLNYEIGNLTEKQKRIYYFSYTFQNDIFLENGNEKLPCVLYHFEQSIGTSNERTFVLAFEDQNFHDEARLVIQSDFFGSFPIKIKVSKSTPTLRTL